jgi:hypothetical protein
LLLSTSRNLNAPKIYWARALDAPVAEPDESALRVLMQIGNVGANRTGKDWIEIPSKNSLSSHHYRRGLSQQIHAVINTGYTAWGRCNADEGY